jgi:hypothetical protein
VVEATLIAFVRRGFLVVIVQASVVGVVVGVVNAVVFRIVGSAQGTV